MPQSMPCTRCRLNASALFRRAERRVPDFEGHSRSLPLRASGRDRDPPFSRLDLISCRNLLIYLDDVAQRRVLRTFHYALRPQGMLFFGPAESVAHSPELFEQIDSRSRVFRRMPNTGGGAIAERADGPASLALEPDGDAARFASRQTRCRDGRTVSCWRGLLRRVCS